MNRIESWWCSSACLLGCENCLQIGNKLKRGRDRTIFKKPCLTAFSEEKLVLSRKGLKGHKVLIGLHRPVHYLLRFDCYRRTAGGL